MAKQMFSAVCLMILYCASASARDDSFTAMVKHIERLDAKIEQLEEKQNAEMEALKENAMLHEAELLVKIEKLDKRVSSLEVKNGALMKENHRLRTKMSRKFLGGRSQDNITDEKEIHDVASEAVPNEDKKTTNNNRLRRGEVHDADMLKPRRALQSTYNVAFSAYMDHDANGLGVGQTLVFNQVLLNDGNGYNKHAGIFIVPTAGVYSFTYFIGQRDTHQLWTALYVNSTNKVDAVVQTDNGAEDAQGGNSVVLKLAAGDVVFIKARFGDHVEGSSGDRFTTFSGFLLYPTEDDSGTIVGK